MLRAVLGAEKITLMKFHLPFSGPLGAKTRIMKQEASSCQLVTVFLRKH